MASIIMTHYTAWPTYSGRCFVNDIREEKIVHINYVSTKTSTDGCIALGDRGAYMWTSLSTRIDWICHCVKIPINCPDWRLCISTFERWSRSMDGYSSLLSMTCDCIDMVREIFWSCRDEWKSSEICTILHIIHWAVYFRRYWHWLASIVSIGGTWFMWIVSARAYAVSVGLREDVLVLNESR